MCFDMRSTRTVNKRGDKTVMIKTTGYEKTHFTVVLTCMADGGKLPPMVIFKRKTTHKDKFPSGDVQSDVEDDCDADDAKYTQEEWDNLFGAADDETDFEGF